MKKFFTLAAFAACSLSLSAQFTVLKSGNIRIGNPGSPETAKRSAVSAPVPIETDSLASLNLLRGANNGAGAYLTFGNLKNVAVGEFCATTAPEDSDILGLYGSKGIKYLSGNKEVFQYTMPGVGTVNPSFIFNCSVRGTSFLTPSDSRETKDIEGIEGAGALLSGVSPVSYRLANSAEAVKASAANEGQATPLSPDDRVRYGFLAQEIREVFPELVVDVGVAEAHSKIGLSEIGSSYKYVRATHNLVGEPEFQVWTSVPKDLSVDITYNTGGIVVTGQDLPGCRVVVDDGTTSKVYNGGMQTLLLPYPVKIDQAFVVSVWKTGYLPIIDIRSHSGLVSNADQSFIVRSAALGGDDRFEVGDGATLRIRAIDTVDCGDGLTVSGSGSVELEADMAVILNGSRVLDGGHMEVTAGEVSFSPGFTVEKGGELVIY